MRFLKTALLAAFLLPLTLAAQVYNTVVFNRNGQPIAGASVAVCLAAPPQPLSSTNACGNGNFATLYTNQGLGTPGPNPVTTDAYGNAVIFAQPGIYYTVVYGYLITPHQNIIAVPVGSGGTPHNLLSATHPDTVAYSPPVFGDIIVGNGSGKWAQGGRKFNRFAILLCRARRRRQCHFRGIRCVSRWISRRYLSEKFGHSRPTATS
jgi:hypothetical protein